MVLTVFSRGRGLWWGSGEQMESGACRRRSWAQETGMWGWEGMGEDESLRLSQATEGFTVRRQPSHKGVSRVQWHCWGVSQAS